MNAQILIKTAQAWFEFTRSKTGQLDFAGKVSEAVSEAELVQAGYQKIAGSTYFTPSYYVFLDSALNANPVLFVADGVDVSDADMFDYLVHVGPLLAAVDAKDSLLAGELYLRRREVFEKYASLTQYILDDICAEVLFSLCFGKMKNVEAERIPLIFNAAKKKLEFDSSRETLEQAFMRYFKKNEVTLTLPVVGTSYHEWADGMEPEELEKLSDSLSADDILGDAEKIRAAKHRFYESLDVAVQAEPYNPHDRNAILVSIESPSAKISGNPGLEKAGYVRALAAKIIREAKPQKMAYRASLFSLNYRAICVQIMV